MINNKVLNLKIPVYNTKLFLSINQNEKNFLKSLNTAFEVDSDALASFTDHSYDGRCYFHDGIGIIRINGVKDKARFHSVLTHELLHYVFSMLRWVGVEHCLESEEAFTYLLGYITETIYENI